MENVQDIYPLTPTQQGILFHTLKDPESEVYFEQFRCTISGKLNEGIFTAGWQRIIERYDALRTVFLWQGLKEPLQVVRRQIDPSWEFLDWRNKPGDLEGAIGDLAREKREKGFDLSKGPLLGFTLIRLADEKNHFIWNFHHLILDGWSAHQVFNEAFAAYESLQKGRKPDFIPARPFRHYLAWLKKQDDAQAAAFWREQLADFSAPTPLVVDRPPVAEGIAYAEQALELSTEVTKKLKVLAKNQRVTLNTVLQGAWSLLLSRYSGQDDVLFGITLSGRPADLPGVENMVGMFINTLPLRVRVPEEERLGLWLKKLQKLQLKIQQFEYSSLAQIQQLSDIQPGDALFQSIMVFENYPNSDEDKQQTLRVSAIQYREQSNYPLAILILPGDRLRLLLIYNSHLFRPTDIQRLLGHLETLLTVMAEEENSVLADLPILTTVELERILDDWNGPAVDFHEARCLHEFVADHARRKPHSPAVIAHDGRLSYAELNERANRLARHLPIAIGTPVGLFCQRSLEMVVGILGILKAGGAYVPLDPNYPRERIKFILDDVAPPLIVSQQSLLGRLPATDSKVITFEAAESQEVPDADPSEQVQDLLRSLAYIIYTSGSTGTPKGVMVTHQNLLYSTLARRRAYSHLPERFLLLSSFSFDSSMVGIFWPLLEGGAIVLPPPDGEKEVGTLADWVKKEKVTHTLALPSLYQLILDYAPTENLSSLVEIIVAGEACSPQLINDHYHTLPDTTLYNEYGPSETTVWSSVYRAPRDEHVGIVPIGRPVANSRQYILDSRQRVVPVGVPGELYIGGAGVSQGYLNRPDLTAERFVPCPGPQSASEESLDSSGAFYRSGDLVRWRDDGQMEYLGRIDQQVKIRGHRVEPGEIESLLKRRSEVQEAAVVVNRSAGQPQLAAFVLAENNHVLQTSQLKEYLFAWLPRPIVPAHIIQLDSFPYTPNGKLDRQALSGIETIPEVVDNYVAPRTAIEESLVETWANVLNVERVGIRDNFFDLGGHSLLAVTFFAQIEKVFKERLPINLLFEAPTIAEFVQFLQRPLEKDDDQTLVGIQKRGDRPPVFFVHGLWGIIMDYVALSDHLGDNQPFYGLRASDLTIDAYPNDTVEEMANRYINEIRKVQPRGPYRLGGFSFGVVVAYEMARQLQQAGEEIALLALIEGYMKKYAVYPIYHPKRWGFILKSIPHWVEGYRYLGHDMMRSWFMSKVRRLRGRIINLFGGEIDLKQYRLTSSDAPGIPERFTELVEHHSAMAAKYYPQPYEGEVILYRTPWHTVGRTFFGAVDPEFGWGNLAKGGVEIKMISGNHHTLLHEPHVQVLAQELQNSLDGVLD